MNEEMDVLIQQTTLELLKHKEYKDIQMKEIAEKANIGRRTLYRYFAYKDEIMNKIVSGLIHQKAEICSLKTKRAISAVATISKLLKREAFQQLSLKDLKEDRSELRYRVRSLNKRNCETNTSLSRDSLI